MPRVPDKLHESAAPIRDPAQRFCVAGNNLVGRLRRSFSWVPARRFAFGSAGPGNV